ncbi:hypothetical protein TCAL_12403 [Tigriopus californicus]|uniref:glutaminyl-peptide cyclotransferase n=1 Tax=Tigriopus californicus TaxID=6832 RepID=A0A553PPD9_TIGCA|nr:glutaminyl-peptide cyclotransferase-like [Tigriopus californicus]TRY79543.1 hypothetical protein TCAL_12403 [Tigriopus californicus]|eukprot:TCALIF_12403-PA protein Name:"Similar to Qpct Glutaminyl-peptide cyclotransferase (Mus musculus)" AED:0.07 eAED:0.07 QI:38/0.5/0.33/1/1/1/3/0/347
MMTCHNLLCLTLFSLVFTIGSGCWLDDQTNHVPTDLTLNEELVLLLGLELGHELNFKEHLQNILIPRTVGSENHTLVQNYIIGTLQDLGWSISLDQFTQDTPLGPRPFTNIIADLNPASPRRMIIAAHYDTLTSIGGFVGATDAAVPVAMMLNLASTMTKSFQDALAIRPDLTPSLVFFDGEEALKSWTSEDSLYGSTHLADLWHNQTYENLDCHETTSQMDRMDVLVLMDLLGTPDPDFQSFQFDSEDDGPNPYYGMMDAIEESLDHFIPSDTKSMFNGLQSSSHVQDDCTPFWNLGLKRIHHWITRPFPSMWHTLGDNWDALDFDYIQRMNMILRIFTAEYMQMQ